MIPKLSGPELAVGLALAVGAGVLGYVLSETDQRKLGRTPWGLPSAIWALFWFLSWLIGLVLYLFAHRAEVRRAAHGPVTPLDAHGRYVGPPPPTLRSTGSDFPAYPRPADGTDRVHAPPPPAVVPLPTATPAPVGTAPSAPPTAPTAGSAPPSWQPDPSGRFHYRWWSGTEWTSYVSTDGRVVLDTSPDQRIGPY